MTAEESDSGTQIQASRMAGASRTTKLNKKQNHNRKPIPTLLRGFKSAA